MCVLCLSAVLVCFGVGVLVATGPIFRLRAELVAVLDPLLLLALSAIVSWLSSAPRTCAGLEDSTKNRQNKINNWDSFVLKMTLTEFTHATV